MPRYASITDVKDFSKLTYADFGYSSDDAFRELINKALDLAEAYIDTTCRVPSGFFASGGYHITEFCDWDSPYVSASYRPIISISSVSYDSTGYGTTPSYVELTYQKDYFWYPDGRVYIFSIKPPKREQSVKLSYTAGYAETPAGIRASAAELASSSLHALLQRKVAPALDVTDASMPKPTSMKIPDTVKEYLAPFRRHL